MATTAVNPVDAQNQAVGADPSYTVEKETVVFGFSIETKDGKKTRVPTVFSSVEDAEKAEKEGNAEDVNYVDKVVRWPKTLEALLALADTPEKQDELVRNHKRGATQKITNRTNAKVLKLNEKGEFAIGEDDLTNGALDMSDEILSESKRKSLTEEERIDRFIASQNWTPEKAAKVKAGMLAAL